MMKQTQPETGFKPCLIKAELSSDLLIPDEDLWVTSWWQNAGDGPAGEPVFGFMDIEFGYQRTVETRDVQYGRVRWEPYPAPQCWRSGDIWATTCRWHAPAQSSAFWAGTYRLYIGLCDGENQAIAVFGREMAPAYRVAIGEVDVSWGWGTPTVEKARKPVSVQINKPAMPPEAKGEEDTACVLGLGRGVRARLSGKLPRLLSLGDEKIHIDMHAFQPEVVVRQVKGDRLLYSYGPGNAVAYAVNSADGGSVAYKGDFTHEGARIGGFTFRFAAAGEKLLATLENVQDEAGYELIEVRIPGLVSMSGGGVSMVNFFGDGRVVALQDTKPIGYRQRYDVRNAGVLFSPSAMLAMESTSVDDSVYMGAMENQHGRSAVMGVNLAAKVLAKGELASIPVKKNPCVEIALLDGRWGIPSWQAAARYFQNGLMKKSLKLYERAMIVRYNVTQGPQLEPGRLKKGSPYGVTRLAEVYTFRDAAETMKRIYHLTDGGPQVVYIGGWEYRGFDTGYPYVLETDPRAGTEEELRQCIREGAKYNALVGMHDNFDDCYKTPHLDERVVALNPEGKPWKGWIWAGGQCWFLGLPKYVKWGYLKERIRDTIRLYGIHTTYHLDVFSSEVIHYDFDPECPASAADFLQTKLAVIEEFNRNGIDVTSETVSHPFIGRISYAACTRASLSADTLFPGEKSIPLTPMVYHGVIRYDGGGEEPEDILVSMAYGMGSSWGENPKAEPDEIMQYYIKTLPLGLLSVRAMLDIHEDGPEILVDYGADSSVKVNTEKLTYEIRVDGRVVGKDWNTFLPGFKRDTYLAYSLHGGAVSWELPGVFAGGAALRAVTLTAGGEGPSVPCHVGNERITIDLPERTPVRVMLSAQGQPPEA